MELFLKFHHKLPVTLLQVFPKVLLDGVNGLTADLQDRMGRGRHHTQQYHSSRIHTHLADKEVCLVKVSPKQSGCFTRYGLNLNAHFLTLAGTFHSFVVHLQASD